MEKRKPVAHRTPPTNKEPERAMGAQTQRKKERKRPSVGREVIYSKRRTVHLSSWTHEQSWTRDSNGRREREGAEREQGNKRKRKYIFIGYNRNGSYKARSSFSKRAFIMFNKRLSSGLASAKTPVLSKAGRRSKFRFVMDVALSCPKMPSSVSIKVSSHASSLSQSSASGLFRYNCLDRTMCVSIKRVPSTEKRDMAC
mmetsp:Transcript_18074/g.44955  ORF Transcript_18074/g.44955 Transcript_18074/m.44955 type:complete len:199 (+) Transcript_18074:3523-4119(+)